MRKQQSNNIGWCHETRNPISGCIRGCPYCYVDDFVARGYTSKKPWFYPDRLEKMKRELSRTPPSRIFMGSTGDMWGPWIDYDNDVTPAHVRWVVELCASLPQHRFIFLTKYPDGYGRISHYGEFDIPENCWCGTSTTGAGIEVDRIIDLYTKAPAGRRFVSIEPYLNEIADMRQDLFVADWLIIGGQSKSVVHKTPAKPAPERGVDLIRQGAMAYKIPLYVKPNAGYPIVIQNFPKGLMV